MNLFNLRRPAASLDDLVLDAPREDLGGKCLMPTVARPSQVFVRGQGSWLWDSDDRAYLDFSQGAAANSLGHSPKVLIKALVDQAQALINPGNGLHNRAQLNLVDRLCHRTGSDQAYLLNSGSEACEAAIKLARKWGQLYRGGAYRIISASNGCHGRSFAAMSASATSRENRFEPQLPGFSHVPLNDLAALHAAVDAQTVAIMLEPIQSEAGVIPATEHYLKGVEQLCRELGILLILDEVQTGFARTGKMFAFEHAEIEPDLIVMSKALGGGLPMAVLGIRREFDAWEPGNHAGTFRGNQMAMATGLATLQVLQQQNLAVQAERRGQWLKDRLVELQAHYPALGQVRGRGLMLGIEIVDERQPADRHGHFPMDPALAVAIQQQCFKQGLLLERGGRQGNVIRLLPPLIIDEEQCRQVIQRFDNAVAAALMQLRP